MISEWTFSKSLLLLIGLHGSSISPTNSWAWSSLSSPQATLAAAPHVSGHSVATVAPDRILLFGGLTGSAGSPVTNDLWCFTTDDQEWKPLMTANEGPSRRMYAASAVLNDHFYVTGGWDPGAPGSGGVFLEDVWKLCLTTMEWTKEAKPMPCGPVSRHSACTLGDGDNIVVHTFRGTLVHDGNFLREQRTTGETPEGLSMCAMIPMGDDSLILVGGSTKTQALSNDVYLLNTVSWEWRKMRCEPGTGPAPLASPCGSSIDPKRCVLFGGATLNTSGYQGGAGLRAKDQTWLLTLEGDDWVTWTEVDNGPEGRVAASLSPLAGGKFVLQGGWDPTTKSTFDTPWILDMAKN